jgi:hypothetical protein
VRTTGCFSGGNALKLSSVSGVSSADTSMPSWTITSFT